MKRLILVLLLMGWPLTAAADDMVTRWVHNDGSIMTLAMRDSEHIRLDAGPDSYMLLSGRKVYMVTREDGKWRALDMDDMSAMMKMFGGQAAGRIDKSSVSWKNTGRTETVAGYTGTIFQAAVRESSGKLLRQTEVVLCRHEDIVRAGEAWMAFASGISQLMGPEMSRNMEEAVQQANSSGFGGILRCGNDMKLASLQKQSLGSGYFTLPEGTEPVSAGFPLGSEANQLESDAVTDTAAGNAAVDEAESPTADSVRKGVKNMFNKLFK